MPIRLQVVVRKDEAARFKAEARKEAKSLSSWLRDAGRMKLELNREKETLDSPQKLKRFFSESNRRERGKEPEWEAHKALILEGYRGRGNR